MSNQIVIEHIRNCFSLSLKEANRKKQRVTVMRSSDLGSSIQKYTKIIQKFKEETDTLEEQIENLKKMFVKAAQGSTMNKLEESIGAFKKAKEMVGDMRITIRDMKSTFGNSDIKAVKSLIKQAEETLETLEKISKENGETLSNLTKGYVPVQLTTNDHQFFRPLIQYVVEDLHKDASGADLKMKESIYMPGINTSNKKELRWGRFIPMVNVPTIDGGKENTNLLVCITFMAYEENEKGKIVPLTIMDNRGVEKPAISQYSLGITKKIQDPIKLSQILYSVTSIDNAKMVLSYLAQKNNLAIFGEPLEGTHEDRMERHGDKLKILNQEGIKIFRDKNKRNFIIVRVDKDKADTNADKHGGYVVPTDPTKWDYDLYLDMSRYADLPVNTPYNSGRLRLVKVYPKGDYVYFVFRVHQLADTQLHKDEIKPSIKTAPVLDKDWDLDTGSGIGGGGLGSLSDLGLENAVNDWLRRNNT